MPLNDSDWQSIYKYVEKAMSPPEIGYAKVVKTEKARQVIFCEGYGQTPIPVVHFEFTVDYYDTTPDGVVKREAKIKRDLPRIGQIAVILREGGNRRLVKCIGIISSTGFVER